MIGCWDCHPLASVDIVCLSPVASTVLSSCLLLLVDILRPWVANVWTFFFTCSLVQTFWDVGWKLFVDLSSYLLLSVDILRSWLVTVWPSSTILSCCSFSRSPSLSSCSWVKRTCLWLRTNFSPKLCIFHPQCPQMISHLRSKSNNYSPDTKHFFFSCWTTWFSSRIIL